MTTITTINTKLASIINNLNAGKTLKASKEELSTIEHTILGYKDQTIRDLCRLASTDRTKVAFTSTLSKLIERFLSFEIELKGMNDKAIAQIAEDLEHEDDNILDSMENKTMKTVKTNKTNKTMKVDKVDKVIPAVKVQTLEKLSEKVEVRNKEQRQADMYKDLGILADTIRFQLDSAQRSFLVVGACLSDANERIKKNGGTQADFLKWAFENCDIRKAQAYKLIKVHKDFGSESGFKGVSMRVLYALTGQPVGIVEQARALAEKGELDSKALDRLIMESQVQPDTNAPVETEPAVKGPAIAPDTASKAPESKAPESNTESNTESETIASLKATIESLNETINSLQEELVRARTSNKPALPALPQFDSTCPATVIGLEVENSKDKVKVNRAYRALASIYTASNNPESASKLKVARDTLLKAIK